MIGHNPSVFRFSDIEVQEAELSIRRNAEVLPVEPKAFRILVHLLQNPGRLIPKDELIKAGWGETAVTDNSLTRNIALLRRLLGDDPREPRFIETVSTVGYRFIGRIEVPQDGPGEPAAIQEPNPTNVQTKVESWKLRWSRGLAAGGLLVICLAGGRAREGCRSDRLARCGLRREIPGARPNRRAAAAPRHWQR